MYYYRVIKIKGIFKINTFLCDSISAIILAAGYSSRMGEFKPLLPIGGKTAIMHIIENLSLAGITDIKVVNGYKANLLASFLQQQPVQLVHNPNYHLGMYSSIQVGVASLDLACKAFLLLPVDYPLVETNTFKDLISYYHKNPSGIIYPTFREKRGHPPLISTRYREEILSGDQPHGLKGLLNLHNDEALHIPVADQAILMDMDKNEDYQRLVRYYKTQET